MIIILLYVCWCWVILFSTVGSTISSYPTLTFLSCFFHYFQMLRRVILLPPPPSILLKKHKENSRERNMECAMKCECENSKKFHNILCVIAVRFGFVSSRLQIMKWIQLFLFLSSAACSTFLWCELKRIFKHWVVSFSMPDVCAGSLHSWEVNSLHEGNAEDSLFLSHQSWIISLLIRSFSVAMAEQRVEFP